jgi:hypothetical protein
MTDRRAKAFAAELAGAYPTQVSRETLTAYSTAFADCLDVADDVSSMLRVRSSFPPSVAQIYEAAREVRKETMSPFDSSMCVFMDGVECRNCGEVHGHLIDPGQAFHGAYHLGRHLDGEPDQLESAKHPESCTCDFTPPGNVDIEKVIELARGALVNSWR